ncbi:MAG: hypothetical protein M3429_08985 [Verrucomicrobiota bacterium]|nr:hypothetical protein [Verrucomicrobiota bacterium]MDQ3546629.1 hypothetical protein [Verrucomicrobiota bacterium]
MNKIFFLTLVCVLPGLAMSQPTPTSPSDIPTGIEGTISISPVRGGPTRQGEPDSLPLSKMAFEVKQDGRVVHTFQTDEQGRFRAELKPGHYTIVRKDWSSAVGSYGPFEVDVAQGKMKSVAWKCDTGLR